MIVALKERNFEAPKLIERPLIFTELLLKLATKLVGARTKSQKGQARNGL